jgi:hypothetical protein
MGYKYIYDAVNTLDNHPDLIEYIKTFDSPHGFMYTTETDLQRKSYSDRLDKLLDPHGMHSGGSWGCMLRGTQAVFCGAITREFVFEKMNEEEEELKLIHEKIKQRDAVRKAAKEAAAQEAAAKEAAAAAASSTESNVAAELLARINMLE